MSNNIQDKIMLKITELKDFIGKFETESVLGMIGYDLCLMYEGKDFFNDISLSSPYKQYMYLAGLITSTNSEEYISLEEKDFKKAKQLLEEITNLYALTFFPSEEEIKNDSLNDKWYEARKVSMPVFLDYFNTTVLNYEEQQEKRIRRWFTPYNDYFKKKYMFSVDELLDIYNYIVSNLRGSLEKINSLRDKMESDRQKFVCNVEKGMSISEASELVNKDNIIELRNYTSNINKIFIQELEDKFGKNIIESFLNIFSIKREKRDFKYYTEENPFELSPLLRKNNEYIFCPVYKQLLNSIANFLYTELEKSDKQSKFYKNRDKESEKEAEELLKNIFGDDGRYFSSVFETNDSHNEHDLFMTYKDIIIIGEVKASKVKEPFRNPDKAYTRIKRDFKSDKGIQKAYNQGLNLKNLILSQDKTTLYDKQGNIIVEINRDDYKKIYIFCITSENYGILATQLSLLLEKPDNENYPWACNLYDLENICNAFAFKKWSADKFLQYIDERTELHENLFSTDELEICGYYLHEGNFSKIKRKIKNNTDMIHFTADMANIFDDIYYKQKGINISPSKYDLTFKTLKDMFKVPNESNLHNKNRKKNNNKSRAKMAKMSKKKIEEKNNMYNSKYK